MYLVEKITPEQINLLTEETKTYIETVKRHSKGFKSYLRAGKVKELDEVVYNDYIKRDLAKTGKTAVKKNTVKKVSTPKAPKVKQEKVVRRKTGERERNRTQPIESYSLEQRIFVRVKNLDGEVKEPKHIRLAINYIQKPITRKMITRKNSEYPNLINDIQKFLVAKYDEMKGKPKKIEVPKKIYNKILEVLGQVHEMLSVKFISSYLSLHGKPIERERAKSLHNRIAKAINAEKIDKCDKYWKEIQTILKSLAIHVGGKKEVAELPIHQSALSGLNGVIESCGCGLNGVGSDIKVGHFPRKRLLTGEEILDLKFDLLNFKGKWAKLCGNPARGFRAMVYAPPKNGKSYFCIDFAKYLADNHGQVCYVLEEEGFTATTQNKIKEIGAACGQKLQFAKAFQDAKPDLHKFDFVFIDSVSQAGFSLEDLQQLEKQYPETSFVYIYHTTKDGKFRGSQQHLHHPDMIFSFSGLGIVNQTGRYLVGGEMDYEITSE